MSREKPSARRHPSGGEEQSGEGLDLDVTPFLNIMFMLILSILAMTSWTQLSLISVQAPQLGPGPPDPTKDPTVEPPPPSLNLTIFILKDGYNIAASGATLDGGADNPPRPGQTLLPKVSVKGKPSYDFEGLNKKLTDIKKTFPGEAGMIISADAD